MFFTLTKQKQITSHVGMVHLVIQLSAVSDITASDEQVHKESQLTSKSNSKPSKSDHEHAGGT